MITLPPRLAAQYSIKGLHALIIAIGVALIVGLAIIQTVRLEGFRFWPINIEGYRIAYERVVKENAIVIQAQVEAELLQRIVNESVERSSRATAERIDTDAASETRDQLDRADAFIAANRVRPQTCGSATGATTPASEDHSAGSGQTTSASPVVDDAQVAVTAEDIRICTVNTIQAEAGRDFAIEVEALTAPK